MATKNQIPQFAYKIDGGLCKGNFNVYQGQDGRIYILMGNVCTALTKGQINDLYLDVYSLVEFDHDLFLSAYPSPLPTSVGEPAKEFEKALDNYARTVLTDDEWDNDYQGQWLGGKVQYLGAHSRFFTGIKSSPPATPVGELPEELAVNEEGNTVCKWRVFETKTGGNVVWVDPDDETPQGIEIIEALIKRYNAYPELEKVQKKYADSLGLETLNEILMERLQEQNRVLVEALENLLWCFEGKDGSNYSPLQLSAIKQGRNAIKLL